MGGAVPQLRATGAVRAAGGGFLTAPARGGRALWACLALALGLRLVNIGAPVVGLNAWRQADNAAMARNFTRNGYRIWAPQIDWGGAGSGRVESEFPLVPFLAAVCSSLPGDVVFWGRLIAVASSLAGIAVLAGLVGRHLGVAAGRWTAFLYAVLPFSVFYGRAFMAESAMLFALIVGVDGFDRWTSGGGRRWFWIAAAGVAAAGLLKVVSLYVGLPLLYLAWRRRGAAWWRDPAMWGFAALALVPAALWYAHAHRTFLETGNSLFGNAAYGTDKWGNWSLLATWEFWNRIVFERVAGKHLTWFGFAAVVWALLREPRAGAARVFDAWLLGALAFSLIVTRGSFVHEHYQIAFVPPAAALAGQALASGFARKGAAAALAGILLAGLIAGSAYRLRVVLAKESRDAPELALAAALRETTDARDLVAAVDDGDPSDLYLADRKGWCLSAREVERGGKAALERVIRGGAAVLAGRHDLFGPGPAPRPPAELKARFPALYDDGRVFVLSLRAAP